MATQKAMYCLEIVIHGLHGLHMYKYIWTFDFGEWLSLLANWVNLHNLYAVLVINI